MDDLFANRELISKVNEGLDALTGAIVHVPEENESGS